MSNVCDIYDVYQKQVMNSIDKYRLSQVSKSVVCVACWDVGSLEKVPFTWVLWSKLQTTRPSIFRVARYSFALRVPMNLINRSSATSQWQKLVQQRRLASTQPPPAPRTYRRPPERLPVETPPELPPVKQGILSRLFGSRNKQPVFNETPDPSRGLEATYKVVREGVLEPRYKQAAKAYTRLIVALPLAIYLGWELYRRRFFGVEQKPFPPPKKEKKDGLAEVEKELG
jgi:hypothetical protein